jgi:hypothetical protein
MKRGRSERGVQQETSMRRGVRSDAVLAVSEA